MTTTEEIDLVPNPYRKCKLLETATGVPVGATPCTVSATEYFWLQTYGPAALDASAQVGAGVVFGPSGTNGTIHAIYHGGTTAVAATAIAIGQNYNRDSASTDQSVVFLNIRQ